jgi:hypothetical protein
MGRQTSRKDIMRFRFAGTLIVAALVTVSCGSVVDPSKNVVDTFSGTLEPYPSPNSSKFFTFSISKGGEFTVKITALAPVNNVFLYTAFGQPVSGGCAPFYGQENRYSVLNTSSLSGPIMPGSYCVAIADPGSPPLTVNETFTLTVSHP